MLHMGSNSIHHFMGNPNHDYHVDGKSSGVLAMKYQIPAIVLLGLMSSVPATAQPSFGFRLGPEAPYEPYYARPHPPRYHGGPRRWHGEPLTRQNHTRRGMSDFGEGRGEQHRGFQPRGMRNTPPRYLNDYDVD